MAAEEMVKVEEAEAGDSAQELVREERRAGLTSSPDFLRTNWIEDGPTVLYLGINEEGVTTEGEVLRARLMASMLRRRTLPCPATMAWWTFGVGAMGEVEEDAMGEV